MLKSTEKIMNFYFWFLGLGIRVSLCFFSCLCFEKRQMKRVSIGHSLHSRLHYVEYKNQISSLGLLRTVSEDIFLHNTTMT